MACETGAAVEAAVCEGEDTCAGFGDPTRVITAPIPLDGIVCVSLFEFGGLVTVTPRFPNNVNNTNNQSIQRKTECHTTFKI